MSKKKRNLGTNYCSKVNNSISTTPRRVAAKLSLKNGKRNNIDFFGDPRLDTVPEESWERHEQISKLLSLEIELVN